MFGDSHGVEEIVSTFLLGFPALFSIMNPIAGAFVIEAMTTEYAAADRAQLARRVAMYSFAVLLISLWGGSYVLGFFGVSIAALRCAGGIVIAMSGWTLLNAPEQDAAASPKDPRNIAFYPLTMPLTAGPGSISVAVALGAEHPQPLGGLGPFFLGLSAAALAACLVTWAIFTASHRITRLLGEGGQRIFTRLIAFVLLCIGIQVLITGLHDAFGFSPPS